MQEKIKLQPVDAGRPSFSYALVGFTTSLTAMIGILMTLSSIS